MTDLTRRHFIRNVALGSGAAMLMSTTARVRGANDAIRLGFVGIGGRGSHSINWFRGVPGVRITALCDVDRQYLEREKKKCNDRGEEVATYVDYRQMLDDKNVDAVVISTTNHTHALFTIWACQAGKDVYCEKPASHNLFEGDQMVAAARKYNRIVQIGTQNRSDVGLIPAIQYIHDGNLGAIKMVRAFCYNKRDGIGKVSGPTRVPNHIDYNLWCGPARVEPLMRKRLHYDWHWVWETGNGDIGNQGPHELDLARWVLREQGLPRRVLSVGGRFKWDDDGETANTHLVYYDYDPVPFIMEVRHLRTNAESDAMDHYKGVRIGIVVECENGYFAGGRGGGWIHDNDGNRVQQFKGDGGGKHARNFIDAVRSRKIEDLNTDVQEGVWSAALAHMGNISYRAGVTSSVSDIKSRLNDYPVMAEQFASIEEHLRQNLINLDKDRLTLGALLEYDTASNRLTHPDANVQHVVDALSTRQYRPPFVVEKIA